MIEYIEKQAAVEAIESVPAGNWSSKRYARELEKIQPAEVRPVIHGKWVIHIDEIWPTESTRICSCCNEEFSLLVDCYYCPNCGAKMEE